MSTKLEIISTPSESTKEIIKDKVYYLYSATKLLLKSLRNSSSEAIIKQKIKEVRDIREVFHLIKNQFLKNQQNKLDELIHGKLDINDIKAIY